MRFQADLAMLVSNFSGQCDHFVSGHCVTKNRCFRFVSKKRKEKRKKIGIHFIISFQYSINILVITVKAGWVFFFFLIYEGTLRRCIFEYVVTLL